jgi:hypothetical protein
MLRELEPKLKISISPVLSVSYVFVTPSAAFLYAAALLPSLIDALPPNASRSSIFNAVF